MKMGNSPAENSIQLPRTVKPPKGLTSKNMDLTKILGVNYRHILMRQGIQPPNMGTHIPEMHLQGRPSLSAAFTLCIHLYAVAFQRLSCIAHIVSFKVFSCRGVTSNRSRRPTHAWKVKCQKPLLVSIGLAALHTKLLELLQNPCVRISDIEGYS